MMSDQPDPVREAHSVLAAAVPIHVAAGLIFRDGRLLIAQRHPDAHLGGLWEFPGGKCEPGETFQAALVRELREELAASVSVGTLIESIEHRYPDRHVRIQFYKCRIESGEPRAVDCHDIKWVQRGQLRENQFPEADAHLLDRLTADAQLWD